MQPVNVTTPFGRRPMTLDLMKRQVASAQIQSGKTADKWKVFRDVCEARGMLGVQDRSLAVLDALLSFYPETELRQGDQLIVFPSNASLSVRAHGMADATLRRHLAALVGAGLIVRKDSANGKRFARKDRSGEVQDAFGFDLSPILARAEEFAHLAQEVAAERAKFRRSKEALTICRRDVRKLISAAIDEEADGDWHAIEEIYSELVARIPRSPTTDELNSLLDEMQMLRAEVLNLLETLDNSDNISGNADHFERHKQNSNTNYLNELEASSEKELDPKPGAKIAKLNVELKAFPLGMVLRACPEIMPYGPSGVIENWRDLMSAAVTVRSMLGVSPSAYQSACEVMGPENAAVAIACILERAQHINSAGGYLRDLTKRTALGEFSLGPMLMALLRVAGTNNRKAG
ncbi:replication initiation protein RepC [Agrobacterium sp. AGB01]|uniref:plasmid replication protein RepC n=1 Tax=Agrobacterium sp. AGB01 TaxID=2769302 RepID=UPI001780C544|nr:plasmid replication protein RepC [Agrobacterium sp. AGB01]MBD9388025.1 replication initiation protein RepC [Agrobacterium sp. AGB01]